jgi:flagellar biogenesis protein FliO
MEIVAKVRYWMVLVAVLLLAPTVRAAADPQQPDSSPRWGGKGQETSIPWMRVLGATCFVVGLTCVGVYVVKKLDRKGLLRRGQHMDLVEARMVGRKLQLYLVRVGDRVIMLASAGDTVTRVAEFGEDELPKLDAAPRVAERSGFRSVFSNLLGARE